MAELIEKLSARELVVVVVDILILYYVIYRVLLLIKGTRAAQMMIGIVLISAGFLAAERFHMTTMSWLLHNFIDYFFIIVIVVFQQDIRRALMRIGQNVVPFGRTHEVSQVLEEVIDAANHLAKARIGGLVVFQREADLADFIDHGEVVDARVSKELLVSLFVPSRDNELHDGAVIIQDLRVQRAGSVLPLSRNSNLSPVYGTRHRAGLGITEETDAVALVISEERGEVALCFKGNIARDLEPDTLRAALQSLFSSERSNAKLAADEAHAAAEISKAVAAMAAEPERSAEAKGKEASRASGAIPTAGEPKARESSLNLEAKARESSRNPTTTGAWEEPTR